MREIEQNISVAKALARQVAETNAHRDHEIDVGLLKTCILRMISALELIDKEIQNIKITNDNIPIG